jgi:hypothetical protein
MHHKIHHKNNRQGVGEELFHYDRTITCNKLNFETSPS